LSGYGEAGPQRCDRRIGACRRVRLRLWSPRGSFNSSLVDGGRFICVAYELFIGAADTGRSGAPDDGESRCATAFQLR
jgi:hypothetical protein